MSDKKTYENWLVSLDSDNFSMFVKTWFAFLASVRELVLIQAREEEKAELADIHGDKKFLDRYKTGLSSIEMTPVMQASILDASSSSREVIRAEYPEYYFQTYFKKIVPFSFRKKEQVYLNKKHYKFDIDVREKSFFAGILVEDKTMAQKMQSKYIKKEMPVIPESKTSNVLDNQDDFYAYIRSELQDRLFKQIKEGVKKRETDMLKRNFAALCQYIVGDARSSDLHGTTFHIWCDEQQPAAMDLKEWFVGFCYSLRNVLFHRTIDPFDSRWSGIMKSCYQGLREFLLDNIEKLDEVAKTQGEC